ncbi:MAG: hypothetical protein MR051_06770 [Lentisphaeria bacterium]|nr:hypothetical protein [Lentisphaeria bacterium]
MTGRGDRNSFRRRFTLVELIVVLVIVLLLTALAVTSLRGESPASALNRQALELESWCAAVRYRCAEQGCDYSVRLMPEERFFYACAVEDEGESGTPPPESGPMRLNLPENTEVATAAVAETVARETGYVEIFRFYPSGGGVCVNRPVIRVGRLAKNFEVLFLSGRLQSADGDGTEAVR